MSTFKSYLKGDKLAALIGAQIMEIKPGYARALYEVKENHLNAGGVCQGGALFTLADFVFAAVTNSQKKLTFTVSSTITFHKSAKAGDILEAIGNLTYSHHKLPCCEVKVFNQNNELLATFSGIGYTKNIELNLDSLQ